MQFVSIAAVYTALLYACSWLTLSVRPTRSSERTREAISGTLKRRIDDFRKSLACDRLSSSWLDATDGVLKKRERNASARHNRTEERRVGKECGRKSRTR